MNGNREDVAAQCGRRGINVIRLARYLSCRALFAVIMAAPGVILWQWPAEAAQVEKAALTQTPGPVTAKLPIPGKPLTVDLGPSTGSGQAPSTSSGQGGGVVMEFVWVEPLKMWVGKYEVTNGEMRRYEPKWFTGAGLRARFGDLVRKGEPVEINGDRQPVADVSWDYARSSAAG
jgi:formylglycine-generating enzyme required for sulfatase activity